MSRLFERERELEAVGELLELAQVGSGQVLLIVGPAGIGKTGLLGAASGMAARAGFYMCKAGASELERDLPWGVVRQLFAGFMRSRAGSEQDLFAGAAEWALPVLGFGDAAAGADALSPALHGLYWLTANLSERAPALLTIDDAQWADPASVRFLNYLARRLADLPVLLALAIRAGDTGTQDCEAVSVADAMVLEPAPLSVDAGERMLGVALGRCPELEFARACHAAAGGNPFLLSELGAQLAADGIEPTAASASQVPNVSPRSVSRWVLLRLSRLPADARRLAEAVVVLGGSAQLAGAAALAGLDVTAARALADGLFAAGVLDPGVPLDFVHPLVRAAVYAEMAPLARDAAHARAARLIADAGGDRDAVAAQLMQTKSAADGWVVETLTAAAASARERGAPEAAVAWLRRALAEPPPSQQRAAVLLQLGMVEAELSDAGALDHLRVAHELTTDPAERARAALVLAGALLFTNQASEASELAQDALSGLVGRDRELELQLEALIADLGWHDSSIGDPSRRGTSRIAAELTGETRGERMILIQLAAQHMFPGREPASQATALLSRALADGRFLEETEAVQFWQAIYLLHATDELDLAERLEQQALEEARKRGSILGLCIAATYRAHAYLQRGRVHEANAEIDHANSFGDDAWPQGIAVKVHVGVEVLIEQGRLSDADREAARLDAISAPRTLMTPLFAICSRGRLRVAQGRFEDALDDLFDVGRYSSVSNPAVFAWRSHATPALAALGRPDEARELLAQELELARCFGVARPIGANLRAAGVLEGGEEGIGLLRKSVHVLERCPSCLERAHSLVELGSALRRSGRRGESLSWLRQGLELADKAGALALAQRARRELADAGARPHRPTRLGRDALTPSELRIARMAAEGATNKEIAQGLFVSLRTVETHLTHTYAKLGIAARPELARALIETTAQPSVSTSPAPSPS